MGLPKKLAPRGIAFEWALDLDDAAIGALTIASPEAAPPAPTPAPVVVPAPAPTPAPVPVSAPRRRPLAPPPPRRFVEVPPPKSVEEEAPPAEDFHLSIESAQLGPWARLSAGTKIGLVVTLALVLGASAAWKWVGQSTSNEEQQTTSARSAAPLAGLSPAMTAGPQGWLTESVSDPMGVAAHRTVSLLRPSMHLADYVIDFNGYIQSKSMGWVFRYHDGRNYYAARIEIIRPGLAPQIALVHWAVVDGEEVGRGRVAIPIVVHADTLYKVRLEVRGPRFTTSLQEKPVDLWSDTHLREGGFGFMNDREGRAEIKSVKFALGTGSSGK